MRKLRSHFLKLNNKGASLITVIITIGFIAILAGTIMMTSLVNFKMKRVNVYAKDTFYSAEQVLDEINVGLQRYISDSLSSAYIDVMQNYSQYSVEQKRMKMQTNYYENMWEKLEVAGSAHKKYDVAVLEGFLKPSTKWPEDPAHPELFEDGYGAIVGVLGVDDAGLEKLFKQGDMETYDTGIVLKDLRVYYKDSKGFISIIETDIRLTYPEIDFAATTELPDIASHVIIADAGMVLEGNTAVDMKGNLYADSLSSEATLLQGLKTINHTGEGRMVIKHDMNLKNASFANEEDASLWVEGIEINSGALTLSGETLVADDLNITGDKNVVTLAGIYNGFGSSLLDSELSSAILINGTNTTIDLSGIEKITLAGHAYIGTKREVAQENEATQGKSSENVFTGESIAVKSNQLMYLVPPECIGVDKTTGESMYRKNPLTSAEYNAIKNAIQAEPSRYDEVSLDVEVRKLNSTLTDYIAKVNGVASPEVVFVPTSDKPLVYYYMKFDNEESANRYFALYYNSNKETYDNYLETYVELLQFPTTATAARIKLAANGVYGGVADGYSLLQQTVDGASTKLEDNQVRYQEKFGALCTKLTDNYLELAGVEPKKNEQILFENIVDEAALDAYIDAGSSTGELRIIGEYGDAVLTKSDYVVADPDVHLVIAKGDVTIDVANFKGTIFANGTVTVPGDKTHSMTEDTETVNAILRYPQVVDGKNVLVAQVLFEGKDLVFVAEDTEETEDATTSMADLIVYENWKKE